jgi:hypothetical protein
MPQWIDDLVADLQVLHVAAHLVDDARGVAAADVEAGRVAALGVHLHDVDRHAERGPDVVVVDAGGHHADQHLVGRDLGTGTFSTLKPSSARRSARADHLGVHLRGTWPTGEPFRSRRGRAFRS